MLFIRYLDCSFIVKIYDGQCLVQDFLPINIEECHWYLGVVHPKLEEVYILDSMGLLLPDRTDLKTTVSNQAFFLTCSVITTLFIINPEMIQNYHNS
jgi:hypothetical protein